MAGKTTILDRLLLQGKIKPSPARDLREMGRVRDPLVGPEGRPDFRKIYKDAGLGKYVNMTPERLRYQNGLESIQRRDIMKAQNELNDLESDKEILQDQWNDAVEEAKDAMYEDWRYAIDDYDFSEINGDLEVAKPSLDLADYWPADMSPREYGQRAERLDEDISEWEDIVGHRESPEYRMELQRRSPRYRNYQRAMEARAANKRMGHQLSRMWGDAYNRLRARGLSDAEARMFIRERFGR